MLFSLPALIKVKNAVNEKGKMCLFVAPSHTIGYFADQLHFGCLKKTLTDNFRKQLEAALVIDFSLTLLLDLQNQDKEVVRLAL